MPTNYGLNSNGATWTANAILIGAASNLGDGITQSTSGDRKDSIGGVPNPSSGSPQLYDCDLGSIQTFTTIVAFMAVLNLGHEAADGETDGGGYYPKSFKWQYDNGSGYVDIPSTDTTGNFLLKKTHTFSAITARYLRCLIYEGHAAAGYCGFNEVRVWDSLPNVIVAGYGSFALNGQNVNLLANRVLSADNGSFALNGQNVSFSLGKAIQIAHGSFALNGQNVNLLVNRVLQAAHGSFALNGQNVNLATGVLALESEYTPNTDLEAPVEITFTDISSSEVTDQRIKFGDFTERTQADDADFSHTYLAPGIYKFERWAKIGGIAAYETYEIVIGGSPPTPPSLAIEFDEIELNRFYSEGATGGPEYSTSILGNPLGVQQRNSNRPMGLHEFELNFEGIRYDENAEENLDEFLDFFHTRAGQAIGFRFFPFLDNRWKNELIALTSTSTDTYNLIRTYSKAGRIRIRRIFKPVPDLIVTINGDPASDYSAYEIDYTKGKIVFADESLLPADGELRVTGFYCIPVVFATDKMNAAGFATYADLSGLRVIELTGRALGITD